MAVSLLCIGLTVKTGVKIPSSNTVIYTGERRITIIIWTVEVLMNSPCLNPVLKSPELLLQDNSLLSRQLRALRDDETVERGSARTEHVNVFLMCFNFTLE